jgi:transposase
VEEVRLADLKEEARVVEGIHDVFGPLFCELGFTRILGNPTQSQILLDCVLARVAQPESKHRTAALLERDFAISIPLDRIYRMMDALYAGREHAQDLVFEATSGLFPGKVDVLFFDVTTLYFESVEAGDLRDFGYSKDQQFQSVQVVLALATTEHGLPVGYKLFPGSTGEVKTLLECLKAWQQRLEIGRAVLVADRAMMSDENLEALEEAKVEYLVGAKLRQLPGKEKAALMEEAAYRITEVEGDLAWVAEFPTKQGRRIIASYSPARAHHDRKERERMLAKLKKRLASRKGKTKAEEAEPARKASVKKVTGSRGYARFLKLEGQADFVIDEAKIAQDAEWDGFHGVITNSTSLTPAEVLTRYRQLWTIEAAFRVQKHDLVMRPIYHWKNERIEAHVLICFLAYALLRHAQYRITLQQEAMSVEQVRNELLHVQASILQDKTTQARYRLPSAMSQAAIEIYRTFGLKRNLKPTPLAH